MTRERLERALRLAIESRDHISEIWIRQRIRRDDHEAHGGDEEPKLEWCFICQQALNDFIRFGAAR